MLIASEVNGYMLYNLYEYTLLYKFTRKVNFKASPSIPLDVI